MSKTIRISDETDKLLKEYGIFGESYDDIIKRLLKLPKPDLDTVRNS